MRNLFTAAVAALLLGGCAAIGFAPSAPNTPLQQVVINDFQAAADNFSAYGMTVEAQCMTDVITKLKGPAGATLKVAGVVSAGSAAYINLKQLQATLGQNGISPACLQVVGSVVTSIGSRGLGLK